MSASLDLAASVSSQPPLMGNVDPTKVDEIRRTVYVGNLNSQVTKRQICRAQSVKGQLTDRYLMPPVHRPPRQTSCWSSSGRWEA